MAYDIGPKIGIEGEAEFRQAIRDINTSIKTLGTEMKVVTSEYKGNENSVGALVKKHQVLKDTLDQQVKKLEEQKKALAAATEKWGEADSRTQKWQQAVNGTQAAINNLNYDLRQTESALSGKFTGAIKKAGEAFAALAAAAVAAAAAVGGAMVKAATEAAAYGDNVDKMSQKIGISAQAYQEWDFVMQHCGADVDAFQSGVKKLSDVIADSNGKAEGSVEAFDKLGISLQEIGQMSQEDALALVIERLQEMPPSAERSAIACDLLGKSATELGPLLNMTAEDTEAMIEQAHQLGAVMSDEAVAAGAAFQDSLQNLQTAFTGAKNALAGEFLPAIVEVMDGLTALVSGDSSGLAQVSQGVNDFVARLNETIPRVMEAGAAIVTSLLAAITENLPTLVEAGVGIIQTLVEGISANLPALAGSAIEVIKALGEGLGDALPELIPAIVEIVTSLVTGLLEHLPEIVEAGIQIVLGLVQGLIKAIPELLAAIPKVFGALLEGVKNLFGIHSPSTVFEGFGKDLMQGLINGIKALMSKVAEAVKGIATTIINTVKDLPSKMADIGKNIVNGVWQGIQNAKNKFTNNVKNFFGGIVSSVKNKLGIRSPSKVFADEVGEQMGLGVGVGFVHSMGKVQRDINSAVAGLTPEVSARVTAAGAGGSPSVGAGGQVVCLTVDDLIAALSTVGVYLDNTKVGRLQERYQTNTMKA